MKRNVCESFSVQAGRPVLPPGGFWCRTVLGLVYLAGCLTVLPGWPLWLSALAAYGIMCALLARAGGWSAGFALALAALACLSYRQVQSGAAALINHWLERLTLARRTIYLPLAVGRGSLLGQCLLSALLALPVALGVHRRRWLLCLPVLALVPGTILGAVSGSWLLLIAPAVLALVLGGGRMWTRGLAVVAACGVVTAAVYPAGWLAQMGAALQDGARGLWHRMCYGGSVLPEGEISHLGPRVVTRDLQVTAQTGGSLYLRGFVGETYTGSSWAALPEEALTGDAGLFYWLHQSGFYAQTQLAAAGAGDEEISITLENRGACRAYAYLPYGLADSGLLDSAQYPDGAAGPGAAVLQVTYRPAGLAQWYSRQAELSAGAGDLDYLAQESAYRDFVYAHYLALPEATAQTLARMVEPETQALTLPQIQRLVQGFLTENLTYDEAVTTDTKGADFLSHVLMTQGRGYSVHYATVAVCLLRYYGVPARYVEGYYCPVGEAGETEPHAWPEIYLDGLGWVPFEVTPGYPGEMELESILAGLDGSPGQSQTYRQYTVPQAPVEQPVEEVSPAGPAGTVNWAVFWLCLGFVAAGGVIWCLWRRIRLCRRLRALAAAPPKAAVAGLYGYCGFLLGEGAFPPDTVGRVAAGDYREALFSDHPMTEDQKRSALAYVQRVRRVCRRQWPWYRLVARWLRGMY